MNRLFGRFARQRSASVIGADDDDERRGHKRHLVETEVIVRVDSESYQCTLKNVGPGGAFLTPSFDVAVGQRVAIELPNSKISAAAGVQRVEITGVGIKFDEESLGAIVASWSKGLID